MAMQLHVDTGLDALADRLADRLSVLSADAFAPDLVVVPGNGVRVWLAHALAERLGVCANVSFVYPAELIRTVLGPDAGLGRWTTGPLTWAIHAVTDSGDLLRARAIADLFDRYTVARPHMARRWSGGDDVGGTLGELADHQRWQPELWRAVQERLGGVSDAQLMRELADRLAAGGLPDGVDLPSRVSLFSITSVPHPHLEVLTAISRHVDLAVFAPVASSARWAAVRAAAAETLRHPVARESSPIHPAAQRLNRTWGRGGEEGHLLLLDAMRESGSAGSVVPPSAASGTPTSLLGHLQRSIDTDTPGSGGVGVDTSVVWHRTFGTARQVEVLRDHILHLLDERTADGQPRFQPRDIVVLSPDVERFAPLVESTFAGDPAGGVPAVPVQVADRSLGAENPVAAAGVALLGLLDGRFRAADVLALAQMPVVARRFGLGPDATERLADLVVDANGRWGLDAADQESAGLPALGAHTLGDALDRAVLGVFLGADGPELGFGGVATLDDVVPGDLAVAGGGLELLDALRSAHTRLASPLPPAEWVTAFAEVLADLVVVDDDRGLDWRAVERAVDEVRSSIELVGTEPVGEGSSPVDPSEMAALLSASLSGAAGRPRFGAGRVTVSSLTAQRGVPHRVVCLLGMDLVSEPSGFGNPDDLVGASPCLGDRDRRSEYRSQLLDAVMSAGERLIVCSTGFDVRTRAEVAPAVAVSELVDALGELVGAPFDPVDHPRQSWSEAAFAPSSAADGKPWSHDAGAARSALARRRQRPGIDPLPVLAPAEPATTLDLRDLRRAVVSPVRVFCEDRLGVFFPGRRTDEVDDQIPLVLDGLERWAVRDSMVAGLLGGVEVAAVVTRLRASGDLPPLPYGSADVDAAVEFVDALVARLGEDGIDPQSLGTTVGLSSPATADRPRIDGELARVVDVGGVSTVVDVSASSLKAAAVLSVLVDLLVAATVHPERDWSAILYRHHSSTKDPIRRIAISVDDPTLAPGLLDLVLRQRELAMTTPVPFFPEVAHALVRGRRSDAVSAWEGSEYVRGARSDAWNRLVFDHRFDEFDPDDLARHVDGLWRPLLDAVRIDDSDQKVIW
jgi:exodeoxyribonuclease V gamma subunit